MKRNHILVTGATGFLGPPIVKRLISAPNYHITILTRNNSDLARVPDVNHVNIEVTPIEDIMKDESILGIIHLATTYSREAIPANLGEMTRTNICLPVELLGLAIRRGVKWFINTGTFFEYENRPGYVLNEDAKLAPETFYAYTKTIADEMALFLLKNSIMSYITLRLFSPYGPSDMSDKIIPSIIRSCKTKNKITLSSSNTSLDFTFEDDIADAYKSAVDVLSESEERVVEHINIATGSSYRLSEIARTIEEITGSYGYVSFGNSSSQPKVVFANTTKAAIVLGWKARTDIRTGLSKTIGGIE